MATTYPETVCEEKHSPTLDPFIPTKAVVLTDQLQMVVFRPASNRPIERMAGYVLKSGILHELLGVFGNGKGFAETDSTLM